MTTVHNYYEKLVFSAIKYHSKDIGLKLSDDEFQDAACLALNQLPPRYVRYDVDTTFFLSPDEIHNIEQRVKIAVDNALNIIISEK